MNPIFSKKKAQSISTGAFLIALGVLFFTSYWWPGILLALALLFGLRDGLQGKLANLAITLAIFVGLYLFFVISPDWNFAVPLLLTAAGVVMIVREVYFSNDPKE